MFLLLFAEIAQRLKYQKSMAVSRHGPKTAHLRCPCRSPHLLCIAMLALPSIITRRCLGESSKVELVLKKLCGPNIIWH
jgi:hypothetical protein